MDQIASSELTVKPSEAYEVIRKVLKSGRVPMLHGSPAIGKSSIVYALAKASNLLVIDLRLSQCEPTDLLGFPYVDHARNKSGYVPMDSFPLEGDGLPFTPEATEANPVRYNGWLLFLDELVSAPPAVQAAAYKLILDRMVGNHKLHKMCFIVGAGNLESDNAVVYPMSSALKSRMTHVHLRLDVNEWLAWAMDNGIHHRITDYIQFRNDHLYNFDPDSSDMAYASPRTWHANNDLLMKSCNSDVTDPDFRIGSAGNVGYGVTIEFLGFCAYYGTLPTVASIVANPTGIDIPGEPGVLFALAGSVGRAATKETMEQLMKFIQRLPIEFQVVTMRYAIKSNRDLKAVPTVASWLANHISKLF
jgi:hypothetical protein